MGRPAGTGQSDKCSEEEVPDSFPEAHRKKEGPEEGMFKRSIRILNGRVAERRVGELADEVELFIFFQYSFVNIFRYA